MLNKVTFDVKIVWIVLISYLVCTFPLIEYIKEPNILKDVKQNILNVGYSYYNLVHKNSLNGIFDYFKNEWLWAYLTVYLSEISGSPALIFTIIGGFNFFIYSYFCYKKSNFKVIFLLLIPIQIVFLIYQPRLSFGCSLWFLGMLTTKKRNRNILLFLSLMIHNAMFVIIGSYFVLERILKMKGHNLDVNKKIALSACFSLVVNFIVGPLINTFTTLLGKQREGYGEETLSSSFASCFFWGIISFFLMIDYSREATVEKRYHLFAIFFTLFPVFSYLLASGYPYRFLTVGMPFVLVSIIKSDSIWKNLMLAMYLIFFVFTSYNFYI